MSECNETPDRSLICTCPRMYAVCSAVPRAVCAVRALKEREDTETVTKRGRRIPDQTSAFIHNSRGEVVSVRLPLLGSLHFLFCRVFFQQNARKRKSGKRDFVLKWCRQVRSFIVLTPEYSPKWWWRRGRRIYADGIIVMKRGPPSCV